MPPRLVVFLTYRTALDAASIDRINFEGWKEVLDAFGYASLTLHKCKEELALKSPHEVMTSLCPFTTKAEWGPLLNKRDVRLDRDVKELCFAEVMPIDGIKEFLIDCSKHAQTTVVLLSPFRETVARALLDTAELSGFVDVVHNYTEQEFGILEACERLCMRPPQIPSTLRHKWESEDEARKAEQQLAEAEEVVDGKVEEEEHSQTGNAATNVRSSSQEGDQSNNAQRDCFLVIGSDVDTIRHAAAFGVPSIVISSNLNDEEEEMSVSSHDEASLLSAGARFVVPTYTSLKFEYLPLQ